MDKGLIVHTLIFNEKKEILIIKRSISNDTLPNYWDLPGGTLEDGENPVKGALREIEEEICVKIGDPSLFSFRNDIDKKKNKQFITLIFIAPYKGGAVKLNPDEHQDYKWLNPKDAEKYQLVDYLEDCIDLLKNKEHQLFKFYQ